MTDEQRNDLEVLDQQLIEDAVVVEEPKVESTIDAQPNEDKPIPKRFEVANLNLECGRCGHREVLELGVENGIQILLQTNEAERLTLSCPKCKNFLSLFFTENFSRPKTKTDEPKTESKEAESIPDVPEGA